MFCVGVRRKSFSCSLGPGGTKQKLLDAADDQDDFYEAESPNDNDLGSDTDTIVSEDIYDNLYDPDVNHIYEEEKRKKLKRREKLAAKKESNSGKRNFVLKQNTDHYSDRFSMFKYDLSDGRDVDLNSISIVCDDQSDQELKIGGSQASIFKKLTNKNYSLFSYLKKKLKFGLSKFLLYTFSRFTFFFPTNLIITRYSFVLVYCSNWYIEKLLNSRFVFESFGFALI
jgi:hypothetical protein